ncbi:sporulation integral membrane protein YtvI [Fuchsiella alkaliacetigena]|uniref:sporulation integral membrane protein YtvI n=1 Tax=Fuchsiella alkaliacetigena TaxID=957042 RepID=UPI00200AD018|nr:sporulation integral membrane protein YtvI [Fuchsiella alkaliacetigena]MCK8823515.1 sporulation integral membrane protein YtvI [Fuchsiella alkaliacetigena]
MKTHYKIALGVLVSLLLSILFFKYVAIYLLPFILALILASLIEPGINFFEERLNIGRGWAVAICLLIILILAILTIIIFMSRLFVELDKLAHSIPDFRTLNENINWLIEQNEKLGNFLADLELPEAVSEIINENLQALYRQARGMVQAAISYFFNTVKSLPKLVITLVISLIATFFISRDRKMINEYILSAVPVAWRDKVRTLEQEIMTAAVGFLRAQLTLISITTTISVIGLLIIGSNYTIVLAIVIGLLDLIPVIGPSLIYLPWAIYSFIIGEVAFGISLLILYIIIALTRQLTEAKIIGKNIGIHPLATLMSMYLGVQFLGVTGFFIGPAILIILKSIIQVGFISILIE